MSRKERKNGIASGQTVDLCALAHHGGGRRSHGLQEEAGCKSSATSQNSGHKINAPARLKEAQAWNKPRQPLQLPREEAGNLNANKHAYRHLLWLGSKDPEKEVSKALRNLVIGCSV